MKAEIGMGSGNAFGDEEGDDDNEEGDDNDDDEEEVEVLEDGGTEDNKGTVTVLLALVAPSTSALSR